MDPSDYVVVACLLLCTVTRLCTREKFWSRIVEIIYKHPSNTYCNMFRFALKMDSSQLSTWLVRTSGRRQEFTPINKQLLRSYVDCCSSFGLVLAWPSPNKLICLLTVFFIRCEVETKFPLIFKDYGAIWGLGTKIKISNNCYPIFCHEVNQIKTLQLTFLTGIHVKKNDGLT